MVAFLLLLLLLILLPQTALSLPPPPPIDCNSTLCTLTNSYGSFNDRTPCQTQTVLYPTTEPELLSVVSHATLHSLKLKVVSAFSHTIPKLSCPSSTSPSVLISTANYTSTIDVDVGRRTVTVDAGVGLRELIERVEEEGLSLVASSYWEGVSVGGLVSTGSHGSSWWGGGGAVHEQVVGMRAVVSAGEEDGFAKVVSVDGKEGAEVFDALRVSLGLLGVISQVTFSLKPAFKRSITLSYRNDGSFQDDFTEFALKHEFADINWYPSQYKAVYRLDDRVPLNRDGDGTNDFIGFQSNLVLVSTAVRATEKLNEETGNIKGKCITAQVQLAYKRLVGHGLKNNNILFTGYPVIGRQGKMQTSGSCLHSPATDTQGMCAWDPRIKGLFFYETTAMFSTSKFRDFIIDVKKLRDLQPENFCGIDNYNGFLIRFVKASKAYLGQPEDSIVVDFNYYRADKPSTPRLNQDVWEEIEQMAFFKYGARPHWGKNRKVAFLGVQQKYPNFSKFLEAKNQLDPQGLFSSEWSDEIIMGKEIRKSEGCAMEGQCTCSEDSHCKPIEGYLCRPGLVYQEARVCRYTKSSKEEYVKA